MAEVVGYSFVNGRLIVFVVGDLSDAEEDEIRRRFGVKEFDVVKLKSGFRAFGGVAS